MAESKILKGIFAFIAADSSYVHYSDYAEFVPAATYINPPGSHSYEYLGGPETDDAGTLEETPDSVRVGLYSVYLAEGAEEWPTVRRMRNADATKWKALEAKIEELRHKQIQLLKDAYARGKPLSKKEFEVEG